MLLHLCAESPAQRERGSLCTVGLFSQQIPVQKSRKGNLRGHLHPRGGHAQEEPTFHVPTSPHIPESKDKQHHKQRLTFLLDSFPPPPKAIWCFVYRESCHGEPACKSASTTACIKLANSWPKEPKKPWESQKNWRPLVWSGTPHVESTVPRCRGSHAGTAGGDRAGTEPGKAVGHQHSTEQPQCTAQAELRPSCSFCSPLWTSKSSPS